MNVEQQILEMPRVEKLRIMEALWVDLSSDADGYESPPWHEGALRESEAEYVAGRNRAVGWDEARRMLRSGS